MEKDPNDPDPEDMNFEDTDPIKTEPDTNPSKKNSNLAITIVIVAGIILGAVLLTNDRTLGSAPGTAPTSMTPADRMTSVPATIPAVPPATVPVTVPPVTVNPIQGIVWQWVSITDQSTGQSNTVPNPGQYTIIFTADGYVNGSADCNSYTGTYSQTNGMTITVTTMTRAACPEGSLEQQYLQLLGGVAAGGLDGSGNLALETAGGAQRMLFQNGGPAQ